MKPLERHNQFVFFMYIFLEGELPRAYRDDPVAAFARLMNIDLEEAIEAEAFAVEHGLIDKVSEAPNGT